MLNRIHTLALSLLAVCLSLTAVVAQEDAGWIRAEIDGEVMEWRLWPDQSDWSGTLDTPQTWINLFSYKAEEGILPSTFRLSGSRVEDRWPDVSVDIDLVDGAGFYSSSNVGEAVLTVNEAIEDGDVLILKGTFTASSFFKEIRSGEPDMTNALLIENAEFEVRIPPRSW